MPGPRTLSAEIHWNPAASVVLAALPQPGEEIAWPPAWRALRDELDAVAEQLRVEHDAIDAALRDVDEACVDVVEVG